MTKQFERATLRGALAGSVLLARNGLALIGLTVTLAAVLMLTAQSLGKNFGVDHAIGYPGDERSGFLFAHFAPPVEPGPGVNGPRIDAPAGIRPAGLEYSNVREQLDVARYLGRKYHLSAEAMELMVREAYATGHESGVEPALLLAVIAVESGFNPFAESSVGAQGLMQVMTKVHPDKVDGFAGPLAVLDPETNIRVGAVILKDCIRRGGSLRDGLRLYVGSTTDDDGGYGARVLQERDRIQMAARGGNPLFVPAVAAQTAKPAPAMAPANATEPGEQAAAHFDPTALPAPGPLTSS